MKYAALILSAGVSSRIHEFKPMVCLSDNTIIGSIIQGFQKAEIDEIMVVTGYRADVLKKHLKPWNVMTCENNNYARTRMFDSVLLGIDALPRDYDALFITPGDVPLVKLDTILAMAHANAEIVRPSYRGQIGHPLLLSARCAEKLRNSEGSRGLSDAIVSLHLPIADVVVDDPGILLSADEPDDYKALRRREISLKSGGKLWPDIKIHIARDTTVLTPEIAQYLEMIDSTGSIQNACACMQMSYTKGWTLTNRIEAEVGFVLVERSQGGVCGGGSALTEGGRRLVDAYHKFQIAVKSASDSLFADIFKESIFK